MPSPTQVPSSEQVAAAKVCRGLLDLASQAIGSCEGMLSLGRMRGTGPGVSFGALVGSLDRAYPLSLRSPFEGSGLVAGAVWDPGTLLGDAGERAGIAKLRWSPGADDLPLHVHDHSDRFIVVLEGRGFFHWSGQTAEAFNGTGVNTIAARERDVFVFRRGLVHTFSTAEHAMTLLSVQSPFLPFEDPGQYRLPSARWTRGTAKAGGAPTVACELHPPGRMIPLEACL